MYISVTELCLFLAIFRPAVSRRGSDGARACAYRVHRRDAFWLHVEEGRVFGIVPALIELEIKLFGQGAGGGGGGGGRGRSGSSATWWPRRSTAKRLVFRQLFPVSTMHNSDNNGCLDDVTSVSRDASPRHRRRRPRSRVVSGRRTW
jgi:hypothetical protein